MLLFPAPFGFRLAIGPRNLPPSSSRLNRGYNRALSWRSEVEQIIEPTMRIITSPTVQFGLDLQYPALGPIQGRLQIAGIHPRPPGIPASLPPTCWPPLPCARLSRARTTTGPPPHPVPSADDGPIPTTQMATEQQERQRHGSRVHSESIDQLGIQLCPGSIATTTPQTFIATSLPTRQAGYGVDHPHRTVVHCIPAHIRQI
jgi:hypothetical protein